MRSPPASIHFSSLFQLQLLQAIAADPWQLRARVCGGLEWWILRGHCGFLKEVSFWWKLLE